MISTSRLAAIRIRPAWIVAACVLAGLTAVLYADMGSTDAEDFVANRGAASPLPAVSLAGAPRLAATRTVVASADPAASAAFMRQAAALAGVTLDKPDAIVTASLPSSVPSETPQAPPPEPPPVQVANLNTADPVPAEPEAVEPEAVPAIVLQDECFVLESCVDHYLWTLYERTAKQDTNKVFEWRKVKVRKKKKILTVSRRFTRLVDADFTWKDPKAAELAGMSMKDYVIGGMDRDFKLKLFQTLRAAEKAGLAPGITSGFRDDYRQSIASGNKAAANRSFHGGSLRGGYGHGVAADVVSVKGATRGKRWINSDILWKWIDANEKEFGIGRPYLNKDPPHVAALDGEEFAMKRGPRFPITGTELKQIAAANKPADATKPPEAKKPPAAKKQAAKKPVRVAAKPAAAKPKKPQVAVASASARAGKPKTLPAAALKRSASAAR